MMDSTSPKGTVIWPVIASHNRLNELGRQIDGLLPQLAEGERIIAVLDGGPTGDLPTKYDARKVEVVCLRRQVGVDRARRVGNAFAPEGAVICEIDDHDYAHPTLLQELRRAFTDRNTMLVTCDVRLSDPEGKVHKDKIKEPGPCRERGMQGYGMRAYRAWVYNAVGGYPLEYYPANDLALLCKIEQLTHWEGTVHIPKVLVTVTVDKSGISQKHRTLQEASVCRVCDVANNAGFKLPFRMPRQATSTARTIKPRHAAADSGTPQNHKGKTVKPHAVLVTEVVGHGRGGGEMSMLACLRGLADRGFRVSAVYHKDAGTEPYKSDWLALHKLETASLRDKHASASRELEDVLVSLRPDVIVSEVRTAANIADVCERLNVPLVTLVQFWHNIIKTDEAGFDAIYERPIPQEAMDLWGSTRLGKSAAFVANSAFTAEVIEAAFGRTAEAIVYPPIKAEAVVPAEAKPVHERRFIVCPSVQAGKGAEVFLLLARRNPDKDFLMLAGDNRHSHEDDIVQAAEAAPNVTLRAEWVADMRGIYAETRCMFIGTQTCESFSRTAAEARANGVPLLVSDAGNLRHICTPDSGVIVKRRADMDTWNAALQRALALRPKPCADYCVDQTAEFERAVSGHRRLSEVAFVNTPATGIRVGVRHFQAALGCSVLDWIPLPEQTAAYPLVILPGVPERDFAAKCQTRIAWWWCSHAAQMDTSRREMKDLISVALGVGTRNDRWLLMTSQPDAKVWERAAGNRSRWLPNVMKIHSEPMQFAKLPGRHVYLPGPFGIRKNVFTALSACASIGAEAHVTEMSLSSVPVLAEMAQALRVKMHAHECPTSTELYRLAGQCSAAVHVSTAETFCLAAAESVMAGTPCVTWAGVPALRGGPELISVNDPTDIGNVAKALTWAIDQAEPALAEQFKALSHNVAANNATARRTLMEILNA